MAYIYGSAILPVYVDYLMVKQFFGIKVQYDQTFDPKCLCSVDRFSQSCVVIRYANEDSRMIA